MITKKIYNEYIACLSLSNLIMMKIWVTILPYNKSNHFYLSHSPKNSYLAALINTVIIAVILYLVTSIVTNNKKISASLWVAIYSITFFAILNGTRQILGLGLAPLYILLGKYLILSLGIFVLSIGFLIYLLFRSREVIWRSHIIIPTTLSPFIIITFYQSVFALCHIKSDSIFVSKKKNDILHIDNMSKNPILWIIFDELDYRLVFSNRPKTLSLPEFDKLKNTSVFASSAYSPGNYTAISIPALLTGTPLNATLPLNYSQMLLTNSNGETSTLNTKSTIFAEMQGRRIKTAIFGWYFPYERIFSDIDHVQDYSYDSMTSDSLIRVISLQLKSLFETGYFSPFGDSVVVSHHIITTNSIVSDVIKYIKLKRPGFIYMHFPVPHGANIYNRRTQSFGTNRSLKEGYIDNIALSDIILTQIRTAMQAVNIWDDAIIIVSSDHHWRYNTYDHITEKKHVPFLVKLPGQNESVLVSNHFETVNTKQMILDIVDHKINGPYELKEWIQNRGLKDATYRNID